MGYQKRKKNETPGVMALKATASFKNRKTDLLKIIESINKEPLEAPRLINHPYVNFRMRQTWGRCAHGAISTRTEPKRDYRRSSDKSYDSYQR